LIPIRNRVQQFVTAIAAPSNRRLTAAAQALRDKIAKRFGASRGA
jgi:hypothetical protein